MNRNRRLALAAPLVVAAAAFLGPSPSATAASATAASVPAYNGATCTIPLTYGYATITRTTGPVWRGSWTSITLSTTGDAYKLVTNRAMGFGSRGSVIRLARGITGMVYAPRSWGAHSRTPHMVAVVRIVDFNTGKYGAVTC